MRVRALAMSLRKGNCKSRICLAQAAFGHRRCRMGIRGTLSTLNPTESVSTAPPACFEYPSSAMQPRHLLHQTVCFMHRLNGIASSDKKKRNAPTYTESIVLLEASFNPITGPFDTAGAVLTAGTAVVSCRMRMLTLETRYTADTLTALNLSCNVVRFIKSKVSISCPCYDGFASPSRRDSRSTLE